MTSDERGNLASPAHRDRSLHPHPACRDGEVSHARVDTIEVRLALRCLLGHCPDRWPLELYWDAASGTNDIGRAQGCTAAFNGIVRQQRLAGVQVDTVVETVSPPPAG
ncbi:hypothetical protein [Sphingomonas oryzagri]